MQLLFYIHIRPSYIKTMQCIPVEKKLQQVEVG